MITHLDPDIVECEVKWALESITVNKASGGDGIPVELFQILEDDANDHPMSQGTRVHQMAMYTTFEAPLQMLADSPTK